MSLKKRFASSDPDKNNPKILLRKSSEEKLDLLDTKICRVLKIM